MKIDDLIRNPEVSILKISILTYGPIWMLIFLWKF